MSDQTKNATMSADKVQPGDVLTIPKVGMLIVRDVDLRPATEETRVDHVVLTVAVGRTDEGFDLTYPAFTDMDVYRSEGIVEEVGS